jgi:hypothetical protein
MILAKTCWGVGRGAVIAPALEKRRELALIKAHAMPTRHVRDYISPGESLSDPRKAD